MKPEELEAQISYYASKYYMGEPEITDEAFDALVDRLREINPNSLVLKTGWGFEVFEDKVKHKYSHIGSLDKCKTYNDIPDIFKDTTIFISPKLDWLSAVAYYKNGQLVKGVTRGNGEIGKDITNKFIDRMDKIKEITIEEVKLDDKKICNTSELKRVIKFSNFVLLVTNKRKILIFKINDDDMKELQSIILSLNIPFKEEKEYFYIYKYIF